MMRGNRMLIMMGVVHRPANPPVEWELSPKISPVTAKSRAAITRQTGPG
jgi:hypothetical protein